MCTTNERTAAYKLIENHQKEDDIFLFDRGFPSVALIQKLNDNGLKFLARVSKSFIGETEILITNLPNNIFKRKDLGNLYALRWGIETGFNHLKNAINIEEFVGIKENSIKQEFYSILIKYNLIMQYIGEAELVAHYSKKTLKLEYKINVRK